MNSCVHKVNRPSFLRRLICEFDVRIGGMKNAEESCAEECAKPPV